ncbi:hypothetical protein NUU61_001211 [Penicillium alfredii]|uniref:EF-hand domain-containing protein n=1 Tax=Penicillium alfredii TaxID=1506179 RepID=A0A9W9GBF4_9EURO|nr:uncharacterized protein NUU61_001211 [Penicillium alfredii]KAJ5115452.1 hypothetical protein NUU61_001211 [Penicillium alfredii]
MSFNRCLVITTDNAGQQSNLQAVATIFWLAQGIALPPTVHPKLPALGAASNTWELPGRGYTPLQSPSKLNQSYTVEEDDSISPKTGPVPQPNFTRELPPSPTKGAKSPAQSSPTFKSRLSGFVGATTDASAKLPANQVREIREAFQVLDRDNDGMVNKDDVADVLMNLGKLSLVESLEDSEGINSNLHPGQDSSQSTVSRFFSGGAQTINFPTFLNTLSQLMSPMSSSQELLNALAAFDDDDNGQIEVAELRDALLHTAPEEGETPLTEQQIDEVFSGFTGRRAFGGRGAKTGGMGKRGEVFQYHDFVRSVVGGENGNNGQRDAGAAQA